MVLGMLPSTRLPHTEHAHSRSHTPLRCTEQGTALGETTLTPSNEKQTPYIVAKIFARSKYGPVSRRYSPRYSQKYSSGNKKAPLDELFEPKPVAAAVGLEPTTQ